MVLKKVGRKVQTVVTKPFKKPKKHPHYITPPIASSSSPPPPPDQPQPMSPPPPPPSSYLTLNPRTTVPFLFPETNSTVLPDPSKFFPQNLLQTPLPTNSFFQNLALKNGDRPEYLHPYIINSADSALTVSYPTRHSQPNFIYQIFIADLIISAAKPPDQGPTPHVISSFDDLSLTLDFPSSNLRFFLVRGCPFITCSVSGKTELSISTVHAILSSSSNACKTKHTIKLNNNQTWLIYTSSPIDLTATSLSLLTSGGFTGILRIAALPDAGAEPVLDRFSSAYPVSGRAVMQRPFALEYKWEKKGWGDLLMLAHPLHLKLLSGGDDCDVTVLDGFKYRSIDGDLVGVVGDSWVLRPDPISITWHSIKGVSKEDDPRAEIVAALRRDVEGLGSISSTTSSYFYGKLIARAARLALIAEEVEYLDVVPAIRRFLKNSIEPWLDGSFGGNGFLYEGKWGGVVTKQGAVDSGADFGFGLYNDHHYHLGYFVYAISVLVKIDPAWGRKFKPQAYSLAADYLTLGRRPSARYTRLRCFDLYKLHSWAGGLTEFADGRNQESTSEAVNAYYSAALLGLAYGDTHLVANGSMLAALEIEAAKTWWHVRGGGDMYEEEFTRENRLVGVLWNNKRDNGLWFAPPEWKECRLGIQLLPIMPISEVLFSDIGFVRELVEWTLPALSREGVGEGWKGFVYALQGVYDKQGALEKIRNLTAYDDGDSLTNLLWWIHSRGGEEEEYGGGGHVCWARHYH